MLRVSDGPARFGPQVGFFIFLKICTDLRERQREKVINLLFHSSIHSFLEFFYCWHYYKCLPFSPFAHPHSASPSPLPLAFTLQYCPFPRGHTDICSLANLFTFFYPAAPNPSSLARVSLSHLSTPLVPCCPTVYSVHQIPHYL